MLWLRERLRRLDLDPADGVGNFMLLHLPTPGAAVCDQLLQHGVIVRSMDAYGLNHAVRVTVGTRRDNRTFMRALESILVSSSPRLAQGESADDPHAYLR
jgi:histidinol-phosphate aminotransferase